LLVLGIKISDLKSQKLSGLQKKHQISKITKVFVIDTLQLSPIVTLHENVNPKYDDQ
jgi:hypothetical protein